MGRAYWLACKASLDWSGEDCSKDFDYEQWSISTLYIESNEEILLLHVPLEMIVLQAKPLSIASGSNTMVSEYSVENIEVVLSVKQETHLCLLYVI